VKTAPRLSSTTCVGDGLTTPCTSTSSLTPPVGGLDLFERDERDHVSRRCVND